MTYVTLKIKLVNPIRLERIISRKLLELWYAALFLECQASAQIIFHESGRGLGHVTPTIFVSTVGYPGDSLASCLVLDSDHAECAWLCSVCSSHEG